MGHFVLGLGFSCWRPVILSCLVSLNMYICCSSSSSPGSYVQMSVCISTWVSNRHLNLDVPQSKLLLCAPLHLPSSQEKAGGAQAESCPAVLDSSLSTRIISRSTHYQVLLAPPSKWMHDLPTSRPPWLPPGPSLHPLLLGSAQQHLIHSLCNPLPTAPQSVPYTQPEGHLGQVMSLPAQSPSVAPSHSG